MQVAMVLGQRTAEESFDNPEEESETALVHTRYCPDSKQKQAGSKS
jgi:hypothetical protein